MMMMMVMMMMLMKDFSCVVLLLLASYLHFTNATTYQLTYDSLISSEAYTNINDVNNVAESATKLIASSLQKHYTSAIHNTGSKNHDDDIHCFPIKAYYNNSDKSNVNDGTTSIIVVGKKCIMDVRYPEYTLEITTSVYTADNKAIREDSPLALSLDTKIQNKDTRRISRNALVQILPIIEKGIITTVTAEESSNTTHELNIDWNIFERSEPVNIPGDDDEEEDTLIETVQSPLACIEERILGNLKNIADRKQIAATYTDGKATSSSFDDGEPKNEVWEYTSLWTDEIHRDFFIDSYLRATTSNIGQAHAEAFVHPAMISHALPKRVAVISDMPVAYVKEILKYESVEDITVVGADESNIKAVTSFLPQVNDCRLIENVSDECMEDSKVEIVKDNVSAWLNEMVDECEDIDFDTYCEYDNKTRRYSQCAPAPLYDVIFVDIASAKNLDVLLSDEIHNNYFEIVTFDSVLVFNIGSSPASDGTANVHPIEDLIDLFYRSFEPDPDSWAIYMAYDEPAAEPLNTAFLVNMQYHSEAYHRFVRETPIAYDLDMMKRFHPQALPPTQFYDGSTHLTYLKPSRSWENWFCEDSDSYECTVLRKSWYNRTNHQYKTEVHPDSVKGRSLHAAEDIPKGAFINSDDVQMHLHIDSHQWEALNVFIEDFPEAKLYKDLRNFFITYGFENEPVGLSGWSVSVASNNTFTNHGCNAKDRNVQSYPFSEDPAVKELAASTSSFSIVANRRPQLMMATGTYKDIKKGEEIAMDYSAFRTFPDPKFTEFLNGICNTGVGLVDAADGSAIDSCIDNSTCF